MSKSTIFYVAGRIIYIYIYIHTHTCVCVRERERERERGGWVGVCVEVFVGLMR